MCTSRPIVTIPSAQQTPAPAPITPTTKEVSESAQRARKEQASLARRSFGRGSTILTGALGLEEEARVGSKTLLGA